MPILKAIIKLMHENVMFIYIDIRYLFNDIAYINKNAKKIFKYLNLKPIKVLHIIDNCCAYNYKKSRLEFGYCFLTEEEKDWDSIFDFINRKFKTRNEKIFFIIAHEIAHYLQFIKYPQWAYERKKEIKKGQGHGIYRKLRMEAKADRIALLVCKKFLK